MIDVKKYHAAVTLADTALAYRENKDKGARSRQLLKNLDTALDAYAAVLGEPCATCAGCGWLRQVVLDIKVRCPKCKSVGRVPKREAKK